MRVVAAQIKVTEDKTDNLQRMLKHIQQINADVICFPELSLQCNIKQVLPIQKDLKILSTAASKSNVNLIFGSYIRFQGKIKNRIFVMNRLGEIIHRYNKRHPHISEKISKGRNNKLFNLDGVLCAVINCWDYAFPEEGRELAQKGAKVIFCPAYLVSFPRTKNVLEMVPQVRAFDYMSYFVMVDAVAEDTFQRSKICHPLRQLSAIKDKEGIIQADLNPSEIDKLRIEFQNFRK